MRADVERDSRDGGCSPGIARTVEIPYEQFLVGGAGNPIASRRMRAPLNVYCFPCGHVGQKAGRCIGIL